MKNKLRKIVSLLLIFSLMLSVFSVGDFAASATDTTGQQNIWDGTVAEALSGDGTADSPYIISNGTELAYAITSGGGGAYYLLKNDIYLNNVDKINWTTGEVTDSNYTANGWYNAWDGEAAQFSGHIDGNGYVIYGLYHSESFTAYDPYPPYSVGLIPAVASGTEVTIKNLGLDNVYIKTQYDAGAFVGVVNRDKSAGSTVSFDSCYVGANAYLEGCNVAAFRAYAYNGTTTITNCYSLATLSANSGGLYGLVGGWSDMSISNSYNGNGPIWSQAESSEYVGVSIENCYESELVGYNDNAVTRTTANMKGNDVFTNPDKMPNLNADKVYYATTGNPVLLAFIHVIDPSKIWDGSVATSLSGGGTEGDPYIISNGAELAYAVTSGGGDAYYKLTSDIYLNDTNKIDWSTKEVEEDHAFNNWYTSWEVKHNADNTGYATFAGTIDGDGHVVYGLYYNDKATTYATSADWGVGLIPHASGAVAVKNLGIENVYLHYEGRTSAFVGTGDSGSSVTIEKCYVGEKAKLNGYDAAAFSGSATASGVDITITDSYSLADLEANGGAAGLIGGFWGSLQISNSYNANGPIMSDTTTDGVTLTKCYQSEEGGNNYRVTTLTADKMQGLDVFENVAKMPYLNDNGAFSATDSYPVLSVFVKAEEDTDEEVTEPIEIWDGETVTAPSVGSGTEASPYEISNGAELAYAITSGGNGAYYKLTSDIYLNDITKINWSTGEVTDADYTVNPWYNSWGGLITAYFSGSIDGDGHTVYGLYYNEKTTDYDTYGKWAVGFIPAIAAGADVSITNLGLDNVYIQTAYGASAFVGVAGDDSGGAKVTIDRCYVGEKAYLDGYRAAAFRAFSVSKLTTVTNCYSLAAITAHGGEYGLVGGWSDMSISNSYNGNGPIWSQADGGEYVGVSIENCYESELVGYDDNAVTLTAANMQGEDVFTNDAKMPNLNTNKAFVEGDSYPILVIFDNTVRIEIWDGTVAAEFAGGTGTVTDPYIISNGAELAYAITSGGGDGAYYKLTRDIYLNNINKIDWSTGAVDDGYTVNSWYNQTETFSGTIDGDGYTVYGLYRVESGYDSMTSYHGLGSGLIPLVTASGSVTIYNLGVDNAYIKVECAASAFVGVATPNNWYSGNVTIDKCYAGENVFLNGGDAGAFVGYCGTEKTTTITNSYSLATTNGEANSGLVGSVYAATVTVNNCYNANGPIVSYSGSSSDVNIKVSSSYETKASAVTAGATHTFTDVAEITAADMQGLSALTTMSKLNTELFLPVFDKTPVLKIFAKLSAKKNSKAYVGFRYNDFCDYYTTESADSYFWRYDHINVNDDSVMDIRDLVLMKNQLDAGEDSVDLDFDGKYSDNDLKILRKALIGSYDYTEKPAYYYPSYQSEAGLSSDYKLVWNDEFNGDYLKAQNWSVLPKMKGSSDGNMIIKKDDKVIAVEDGHLRLTAYKDGDKYYAPFSVATQNTMNFKYGYVEIRAALPLQDGVWSSFWTRSVADPNDIASIATSNNPVLGEVDIIEVFDINEICANIIKWDEYDKWENWNSWSPTLRYTAQHVPVEKTNPDEYHIYGYEWTEDRITMYYDGTPYATFDITEPWLELGQEKGIEGWEYNTVDETGTDMSCFKDPQYLVFNNHLFYPGVSGASKSVTENADFTEANYLIDYCRVYQRSGEGELYVK